MQLVYTVTHLLHCRARRLVALVFASLIALPWSNAAVRTEESSDLRKQIDTLLAVDSEGVGNIAAGVAGKAICDAGGDAILPLLAAMGDANPLAANWLRSSIETIVARELAEDRALPVVELGAFLLNRGEHPQARRLAYELIARIEPDIAKRLVPGMIDDPSTELRRDAVALLIIQADARSQEDDRLGATLLYQQALNAARDIDQIQTIAAALEKLEVEVDLPRHFGFLMRWKSLGPFDNTGRTGFEAAYPPEDQINMEATYTGKEGPVGWKDLVSTDSYGKVDFNGVYTSLKQVAGYAYTEFQSANSRPAELRLGCKNAWKVWVNGDFVFGRDEYHRGQRIDQYRLPIQLKEGRNTILIKACQNEQEEDWTVQWEFQARVCDATGTAILSTDRQPTPKAVTPTRRTRDD